MDVFRLIKRPLSVVLALVLLVIVGAETTVAQGVDVALGGTNEPTVVVNPLNAQNIAVADLFSLRVSTDGGATFSAATAPPVPAATHGAAGDPSLAFDGQGRLFWTYLGIRTAAPNIGNLDVFISQVNPATGAIAAGPFNVTASAGFPASVAGNCSDKQWLAADRFPGSPFQDRLYVVWTRFTGTGAVCTHPTVVHTSFSADQGATWSAALTVSAAGEGFVWPSHNAVAANGDVYAAYHSQPTFAGGEPNGISGRIFLLRSTNGGGAYPQKTTAYAAGNADITFNVQAFAPRKLHKNISWTQGSAQPWVLPDPTNSNNVYVVAADDPTNGAHGGANDDMAVYIARSTNRGRNFGPPAQVDTGGPGPGPSHQFFPTAGIDHHSQCLSVTWYDSRAGATNVGGNFLLDLFSRTSADGGLTFGPEVQLNDAAFNPDLGAPVRFPPPPAPPGPTPTLRIGEYNGVAVASGTAHAVWTGNTATGQQILYDRTTVASCQQAHYKCYDIVGLDPDHIVNLETQFGLEENVEVGPATLLCPPALKDGAGNLNAPHLKCYNIVGDDPPHSVNLTTQFGKEVNVAVGQAKLLCVPALKKVVSPVPGPDPPGTIPSAPHYKCYEIVGDDPPNVVKLETQFGVEPTVPVEQATLLCAPALKQVVSPTPGPAQGDLTAPHLKCYNILGHNPPHVVDLFTQFGPELNIPVEQARLLCVPAIKTIPPSVGGIAEVLAEGSDSPAPAAGGGGRPGATVPYAAIAGAVVGALLALAAGGWYARRRLLR